EQECLELIIAPVDLVNQQHGGARSRMVDGGKQRPGKQEVGAEEVSLVRGLAPRPTSGPRSTAALSVLCRGHPPGPWRPRSCRRRARPPAALAGPSARRGT